MRGLLISVLATALAGTASAQSEPASDLTKVLQARYDALVIAKAAKDNAAGAEFFTADFHDENVGNARVTTNFDRIIAAMEALPDPGLRRSVKILTVAPAASGDAAEVEEVYEVAGVRVMPKDGLAHPVKLLVERHDSWVRLGGQWRMRATEKVRVTHLIDGEMAYAAWLKPPH